MPRTLIEYTVVGTYSKYDVLRALNRNQLMPGTIIQCDYKGRFSTDPKPKILVLNGNWKKMCHGVALNVISPQSLSMIVRRLRFRIKKPFHQALIHPGHRRHLIHNPYQFYYSFLKSSLIKQEKQKLPYRTYYLKNMKNIQVLDYRFYHK